MPVRYIAILILFMVPAFAERTRTEVTKATTPEGDSKPNSDKVPEATAISAQFQRIVILRFKYQTDLLTAFEKLLKFSMSKALDVTLMNVRKN